MIRSWVGVLASFHLTPVFGRLWFGVIAISVYAALVVAFARLYLGPEQTFGAAYHGFLGLVLGLLLVFRTNTSYERWWEGRKLWGQLVNDSRNLAIKVRTCVCTTAAEKQQLGAWLVAFAFALKDHLRGGARLRDLPGFHDAGSEPPHVPAYVSAQIYQQLETWRQANQLGGFELLFLDEHAAALMNICGACERIKKSPISPSYRWFIRQLIAVYLLTLPWGLLDSLGYWAVAAVGMLSYFMIGLELIAEEIEDPFGESEDDLMLDDRCATIQGSVTGILSADLQDPPLAAARNACAPASDVPDTARA